MKLIFYFNLAASLIFFVQASNFDYKEAGVTCLFARMNATFQIPYQLENGSMSTRDIELAENAAVSGDCADGKDSSVLILTFHEVFTLHFTFRKIDDIAYVDKVSLKFRYVEAYFPGVNQNLSDVVVVAKDGATHKLSASDSYFTCLAPTPLTLTSANATVQMLWRDILLQPFGIKDGKMSETAHDCLQDLTTTAVTSNITTESTGEPAAVGNWNLTVRERLCVRVQMAAVLSIRESGANESGISKEPIPTSAVVDPALSFCGNEGDKEKTSVFALKWPNDWLFQLTLREKDEKVYISEILVQYHETGAAGSVKRANVSDLELFKMNEKNYYKCDAEEDTTINENVSVSLSNVKLQAFRNDTDSGFTGSEEECLADENTSALVPIIVGASLAALVVLVLIFYVVCRKRRGSSYQSVE